MSFLYKCKCLSGYLILPRTCQQLMQHLDTVLKHARARTHAHTHAHAHARTRTHMFVQLSLWGLYIDFYSFVQPNPNP